MTTNHLPNHVIAGIAIRRNPPNYAKLTEMIGQNKVVIDARLLLCFPFGVPLGMQRLNWLWDHADQTAVLREFWSIKDSSALCGMVMRCICAKDLTLTVWASERGFLRANVMLNQDIDLVYGCAATSHQSAEVFKWWNTIGIARLGYEFSSDPAEIAARAGPTKRCTYCGEHVQRRSKGRLGRCMPEYFCVNCWNGANTSKRKSN